MLRCDVAPSSAEGSSLDRASHLPTPTLQQPSIVIEEMTDQDAGPPSSTPPTTGPRAYAAGSAPPDRSAPRCKSSSRRHSRNADISNSHTVPNSGGVQPLQASGTRQRPLGQQQQQQAPPPAGLGGDSYPITDTERHETTGRNKREIREKPSARVAPGDWSHPGRSKPQPAAKAQEMAAPPTDDDFPIFSLWEEPGTHEVRPFHSAAQQDMAPRPAAEVYAKSGAPNSMPCTFACQDSAAAATTHAPPMSKSGAVLSHATAHQSCTAGLTPNNSSGPSGASWDYAMPPRRNFLSSAPFNHTAATPAVTLDGQNPHRPRAVNSGFEAARPTADKVSEAYLPNFSTDFGFPHSRPFLQSSYSRPPRTSAYASAQPATFGAAGQDLPISLPKSRADAAVSGAMQGAYTYAPRSSFPEVGTAPLPVTHAFRPTENFQHPQSSVFGTAVYQQPDFGMAANNGETAGFHQALQRDLTGSNQTSGDTAHRRYGSDLQDSRPQERRLTGPKLPAAPAGGKKAAALRKKLLSQPSTQNANAYPQSRAYPTPDAQPVNPVGTVRGRSKADNCQGMQQQAGRGTKRTAPSTGTSAAATGGGAASSRKKTKSKAGQKPVQESEAAIDIFGGCSHWGAS